MTGSAENGREPPRLTVRCPVTVRVRVTDRWKLKTAGEWQEALRRTEQELLQMEAQLRRLQGAGEPAPWREQAQSEVRRLRERRAQLLEQLRHLARLEPGSEVVQGQVEGLAHLRVGDRWDAVTSAEVVLEDGVVVEIRTGWRSRPGPQEEGAGEPAHRGEGSGGQ